MIRGETSWKRCNLLQVRRGFGVGVKGVRLPARFDITLARVCSDIFVDTGLIVRCSSASDNASRRVCLVCCWTMVVEDFSSYTSYKRVRNLGIKVLLNFY